MTAPTTPKGCPVRQLIPDGDSVCVVIPAFNEEARLGQTLREVGQHFANIVVIDDGSCDDTSRIALAHEVWLIQHHTNCGQGAALQTGIDFGLRRGAQIIVTFDADGQHCAEDIASLIEPIRSDKVDVVLGSRFLGRVEGLPWLRRLVLQIGILFTRVYSRLSVTDTHNGLRALSRLAAERIRIHEDRMAHASEILHQIRLLGLRYCERPVTIRYTPETLAKGQSTLNVFAIATQFIFGRLVK